MSDAKARIEIEAGTSRLPAALRAALGKIKDFGEEVGKVGASVVKSTALGFIHGVGMSVANRGLDLLIDQGKKVIDFQRELTRLQIDLNKQPGEMQQIGQGIREISNQTGMGADKVLQAGRDYADLAGLQAFTMERMSLIARAAQASGSDVKDMAALMFTLTENMKVPDNQLEDTIGGLINQAKYGSIHFRELAHELVALGSVYSQFGVTGREGVIQIGAQMQLARHGFASASEAATGVLRIYRSLPQHAPLFAKAGVDIFVPGSKKKMREFEDIIHQIQKSRLDLDRAALIKTFGRTEGERFYQVLTSLTAQYDEMKKAGEVNGTVARDLATYTESAAGRIDVATERIKNGFAEALTPERIDQIVGGIEQIVASMPKIVGAISTVMDAFSGMVNLFQGAHDWRTGIRGYQLSKEDRQAYDRARERDDEATQERIRAKERGYEEEIADIIAKESATGPTRASIEHAVRDMIQIPSTPGREGGSAAGASYLKDRGIPDYMVRQIMTKIASDSGQLGPPLEERIADAVKDGVMAAMRHPALAGPTAVYMDGSKVNSVTGDASNNRRR